MLTAQRSRTLFCRAFCTSRVQRRRYSGYQRYAASGKAEARRWAASCSFAFARGCAVSRSQHAPAPRAQPAALPHAGADIHHSCRRSCAAPSGVSSIILGIRVSSRSWLAIRPHPASFPVGDRATPALAVRWIGRLIQQQIIGAGDKGAAQQTFIRSPPLSEKAGRSAKNGGDRPLRNAKLRRSVDPSDHLIARNRRPALDPVQGETRRQKPTHSRAA